MLSTVSHSSLLKHFPTFNRVSSNRHTFCHAAEFWFHFLWEGLTWKEKEMVLEKDVLGFKSLGLGAYTKDLNTFSSVREFPLFLGGK